MKNNALEFYLMKQDENGELKIKATGHQQNDQIAFPAINLEYGIYPLGWKNSITGLIDRDEKAIRFFPNPSEGYLILTGLKEELDQVFVHDINGLVIAVDQNRKSDELIIDTKSLNPGMYVIVISSKKTKDKQALRFIKQ
ncbi:MAG: T9SS type A sorting domain-containing protein [Cytophagaceae bacterium]|nr:T9SS type A sorting domain-containing protein [Cytophagaceae bacterium]